MTLTQNKHHNIPRSYGGSNDLCNIPTIDAGEHTHFHSIFGHLTPDQLLRMLIVSSAYNGPPKSFLSDFLNASTERDWRGMYDQTALRDIPENIDSSNDVSQTYLTAALYAERAQEIISDLNQVFRQSENARLKAMDEQSRMSVHYGMMELDDIMNNYRKLLQPPNVPSTHEGVTPTRISLHTAYQLLAESSAAMSSVQALLGQNITDEARQFRSESLRFFRSLTGADAAKEALNKTNGMGLLLYANPLTPHTRARLLHCLKGVNYKNPDDSQRKELITVLNAHTRRLLGSLLSEQQIISSSGEIH